MLNRPPVTKSQIIQHICQAPHGQVWTPADFLDLGGRDAVERHSSAWWPAMICVGLVGGFMTFPGLSH